MQSFPFTGILSLEIFWKKMERKELVVQCQKQDKKAQSLLYKEYSKKLNEISFRIVQNKQIAEDLVHDGVIIILASIVSLRDPEKLESWMARIITNLSLKYIQQQQITKTIPLDEIAEPTEASVDDTEITELPFDVLNEMIEKLPEGYKIIFRLSVLDGLSHKEIADILHIKPHSSSSQFFRAKKQLKKIIMDYKAKVMFLLALLLSIGWFLFKQEERTASKRLSVVPKRKTTVSTTCILTQNQQDTTISKQKKSYCRTSISLPEEKNEKLADNSISESKDTITPPPHLEINEKYMQQIKKEKPSRTVTYALSSTNKWSLALVYKSEMVTSGPAQPKYMDILRTSIGSDGSPGVPIPGTTDSWDEYYEYLVKYYPSFENKEKTDALIHLASQYKGRKIDEQTYHRQPFTVELIFNKPFARKWSLDLGVSYTRLTSNFKTGQDSCMYTTQKIHYIGVGIKMNYHLWKHRNLSVYSATGFTMECPIVWDSNTDFVFMGRKHYSEKNSLPSVPLQWSVQTGIGIQYKLNHSMNFFVEPRINYFFNDESSISTSRKEKPFTFSVPIGIRWNY